ncbi:hypothetical protein OB955_07305 [Halobacteria archaeon AArc-m2/3/4]|uniref:Uncharacterized protein n=1 Tax=Natronoglomus mannanivorans TaxID=2979990 RepID=A0AAP3E176_9EURY|nr:hypothetical protein [Halobacteria archaeon AArc-xg1-1]MCU4972544.1 hypothetical protein [Halobacteria archaeon AArc-m2/3/4]
MTPVLLAGFCTSMAALALGKLALADERDGVDFGTAAVVTGVAALTLCWAVFDVVSSITVAVVALAVVGCGSIVGGVGLISREW